MVPKASRLEEFAILEYYYMNKSYQLVTDGRTYLDIVEIGTVTLSNFIFTYAEGEDFNTVWNGKVAIFVIS